jgi:hypothetical protein
MLIEFTVGNYLSFKEKKTLSLEATAIKDNPENVIDAGKYKLLRSAVIYGANSSGKSNLIKALTKMRILITSSTKLSSTTELEIKPFLLSTDTENQPSSFEILFLLDGIRYRYGFEVDNKKIHAEWLFECKLNTEKNLFIREDDNIEISNEFEEGKGIEGKTRSNALFLSVVDQFNGAISKKIMEWVFFTSTFSGIEHENMKALTTSFVEDTETSLLIRDFLTPLNLGFQSFALKDETFKTLHHKFDKNGTIADTHEFDLIAQESSGTNKLFDMSGVITFCLRLGKVVVIDELDAKLHPLLTMAIVKLFNSPETNPKNAQLIFATHDTNLLNYGCFRRGQIYFTEKDRFEATDLYSLAEYKEPDGKKVRKDRSFEKDYIEGRYGAIPFVGDFSKLITDGKQSEN